jgi:hypothetical protein
MSVFGFIESLFQMTQVVELTERNANKAMILWYKMLSNCDVLALLWSGIYTNRYFSQSVIDKRKQESMYNSLGLLQLKVNNLYKTWVVSSLFQTISLEESVVKIKKNKFHLLFLWIKFKYGIWVYVINELFPFYLLFSFYFFCMHVLLVSAINCRND